MAVVGEPMVGKTAICKKMCLGEFTDKYLPTTCSELFKTGQFYNGDNYHIKLWDISGNPRFQYKRKEYLSGSAGIFIVCDLTRDRGFASCANWLYEIESVCPDAVAIILANKADLQTNQIPTKFNQYTVIKTSAVWPSLSLENLLERMLSEIMNSSTRSSVFVHNKGYLSFSNTNSQAKCTLM
tara:strand:+ start:2934 stop:3482 length:549 start_codon:yes stop_codon:yes gene_type:complete